MWLHGYSRSHPGLLIIDLLARYPLPSMAASHCDPSKERMCCIAYLGTFGKEGLITDIKSFLSVADVCLALLPVA